MKDKSSYKVDSVACLYVGYWTQRIFDELRTVPPIVIAYAFCALRDSRARHVSFFERERARYKG